VTYGAQTHAGNRNVRRVCRDEPHGVGRGIVGDVPVSIFFLCTTHGGTWVVERKCLVRREVRQKYGEDQDGVREIGGNEIAASRVT
jgi:hypothetical protein